MQIYTVIANTCSAYCVTILLQTNGGIHGWESIGKEIATANYLALQQKNEATNRVYTKSSCI